MLHRDEIVIKKVLSEIRIAFEMLADSDLQIFLEDEKLKRAICMTVVNIGELVKNMSSEGRAMYSHVPWKELAGIRDITAHRYQTLRMEDVFYTVKHDLPEIEQQLKEILKQELSAESTKK